jgi:hypothetical protein
MEEAELKRKVQLLYSIRPREDWVALTKSKLIENNACTEHIGLQKPGFWGMVRGSLELAGRYLEKPAFVMPVLACVVAGGAVWQGAASSLPGDALYALRAVAEQVPLRFSKAEERQVHEFRLAQQRLADLRIVAQQNKVKNLPSAIQEFEANASKVSAGFVYIVENEPEKALQASKQVVELQKEKSEIERILGAKISEQHDIQIQSALRKLVDQEFAYLETRSLTESQEQFFLKAKEKAKENDYAGALEILWDLSQNP